MYTLEQKTQQIFILRAKQTLYFWRFGVNLLQNRMRCIYYIHLWGPEPHQGRISNFESEHLGIGNHLGAFLWAWQCSQMVSHNQKPEGWNQNYVSSMNRTKSYNFTPWGPGPLISVLDIQIMGFDPRAISIACSEADNPKLEFHFLKSSLTSYSPSTLFLSLWSIWGF